MAEDGSAETVLHEEVGRVETVRVGARVARLQRVVVRERRTIEVEVAHEEYRVVVDDLDPDAVVGGDPGPRTASTVLREERIELVRRIVPVERVVLTAEPVAGEQQVDVVLRHEEAEVDERRPAAG